MSLPGPRRPHLSDDLLHRGGAAYEVFPAESAHGGAGDAAGADQVAVPAAQLTRNIQSNEIVPNSNKIIHCSFWKDNSST